MGGFDWGSIAETDEQAKRRALLLQALERQRKRAQELESEEDARTDESDPFALGAKLANPAYYLDQNDVAPSTAAEKAERMLFDMLSSGGAQASISPGSAVGVALYEQLGSLLSAFDRTEPS